MNANPGGPQRDPRWWLPPLLGASALFPLFFVDFFFYSFSVMYTDSCGPDQCPTSVTMPLTAAPVLYGAGIVLVLLSALLPWWPVMRPARIALAATGVTSGAAVVPLLLTIHR
ncbi:membrane protein [Streptomyces noursei ATCC 11455]|uniref:Uncharacterized protein n=1 Tax=Streptomyces yunnanensis TaxID=156453 RepID=A0A9X8MQI2_9ACTN|nr:MULTISPECIES: hypothetical protein [Streptomyces]ANZ21115.1 membrane protein [Streptomyces noursei ATCC 11455]SHL44655.1 hypothetical protein SAMN05216268_104332 [Streptomyces yunnanensis]